MKSHGPQPTNPMLPALFDARQRTQIFTHTLPQFARRAVAVGLSVLLVPMTTGVALAQQAPGQQQTQQFDGSQDPGQMPDPAAQNMAPPNAQDQYGNDQYSDNQQQYGGGYSDPNAAPQYGQGATPTGAQPLSASQLDQLVAPIALYPDSLVAQILAASTYPSQIVEADRWRQSVNGQQADQIAAGIDAQQWDPSVKAVAAFPSVLSQMDRNLQWTTDLGNAYYNQPQDVMNAVQEMRGRAEAAGNLRSTPQQTVTEDNGEVEIAPANPEVVYVPTYDPWVVYGEPIVSYPAYYYAPAPGVYFGSGLALGFGLGIAIGAFTHFGWGWGCWGANWGHGFVAYNHDTWYTHSTTVYNHGWGRPGGPDRRFAGMRGAYGHTPYGGGNHGFGNGYGHGGSYAGNNGFNRGGFNRTPYGGGINRPGVSTGFNRGGQPGGFNHTTPYGGGVNRPGVSTGFNRGGQPGGFNHTTPYGGGINRPGVSTGFNRGGQPGGFNRSMPYGGGFNRPGNTTAFNHSTPYFPGGSVNRGSSFGSSGTFNRSITSAPRGGAPSYGGFGRSFDGGGTIARPGGNMYAHAGGFSAPRPSGGFGGSFGGGSHYSAPRMSAPHFSGGGGGHFSAQHLSAPHFSGGGGHFGGGGGGHFGGGGGGHFGGGGGGHFGGGGGGHHR